jgi:hypothetical protein
VLWRTATGERLRGELTAVNQLLLAASLEGTLFAFAASDGKIAWRHKLGDLLFLPPRMVGGNLLAIGANNTLRLLDPATGQQKAELVWPAWLTGVAVTKAQDTVICADQNGTVAFLAPDTLAVRRTVELHERLAPGLLCAEEFPLQWAIVEDLGNVGTVALVADKRGFLYLLPTGPERK